MTRRDPTRSVHVLRILPLLALVAACACAPAARGGQGGSDPKAIAVAEDVMKALGGRERWEALPGLRWQFGSTVNDTLRGAPRKHVWDKMTGRHRVEGVTRDGVKWRFVHTVGDTLHGQAWMNGTAIEGDSLHKLIRRAEALWINDTYWLLMPYKLRDRGVTLKYDGEKVEGQTTYDVLGLSFGNVGMTPGDRYWVYVDRANHHVERWEMVLQGDQPPPVVYTWDGWMESGGLLFPTEHHTQRGNDVINLYTGPVEALTKFLPGDFTGP